MWDTYNMPEMLYFTGNNSISDVFTAGYFAKMAPFRRQLNAHINGLRAAGQEGWDAAFKNDSRWKTESEAFICWLLTLERDEPSYQDVAQHDSRS
jgi:hypothetical protein